MADGAAVRFDDAVAHRQAETGPLADGLRREERLKQLGLVVRRYAGPVVLHLEAHFLSGVEHANEDAASRAAGRLDRLLRVDHEVENDLLDLREVRVHLACGRHLDVERNRRVVEIAAPQLHHFGDYLAEVDERRRPRLLTAEARQVPDDLARTAALGLDERDLFERLWPELAMPLEELCGAENRLQGIVQLVRDAGNEHADGGEPLLPNDLPLERLQHLAHPAFLFHLTIERFVRLAQVRRHG